MKNSLSLLILLVFITSCGTNSEPAVKTFTDNFKIPTNIPIENPVRLTAENYRPDSILALKKSTTDFQLYYSFQPGLFEYDFWTGKIEQGTIYLKAFEITQNHPLSAKSVFEKSALNIYNPSDNIIKFCTTRDFTIYEGDWGKPYAARFEIWFKPTNGGKEKMLREKNYKIEGWQR